MENLINEIFVYSALGLAIVAMAITIYFGFDN